MDDSKRLRVFVLIAFGAIAFFATSAMAAHVQINIQNFAFVPAGSRINVGDTITWTNRDVVQHTSTSDNGVWDSGSLNTGQSYSFVFVLQGVFPYHCTVHPFMHDTITVSTVSGIDEQDPTPGKFELSQNYPNPFNASTSISFSLKEDGHAKLEVFDLLGRKVDQLIDQDLAAGSHECTWNAGAENSGIFFYRLTFDNETKTGRMVLLK